MPDFTYTQAGTPGYQTGNPAINKEATMPIRLALLTFLVLNLLVLVACGPGHSGSVWPVQDYSGTYAIGTTGETATLTKVGTDQQELYDITTTDGKSASSVNIGEVHGFFSSVHPVTNAGHTLSLLKQQGGSSLTIIIDGTAYTLGNTG